MMTVTSTCGSLYRLKTIKLKRKFLFTKGKSEINGKLYRLPTLYFIV